MARQPVVKWDISFPGGGFDGVAFTDSVRRRLIRYLARTEQISDTDKSTMGRGVFSDRMDAEAFAEWLVGRLGQTGGPTGSVTIHDCSHADGGPGTEPCDDPVTRLVRRTG